MKINRLLILFLILLSFITICTVSASDINSTVVSDSDNEEIAVSDDTILEEDNVEETSDNDAVKGNAEDFYLDEDTDINEEREINVITPDDYYGTATLNLTGPEKKIMTETVEDGDGEASFDLEDDESELSEGTYSFKVTFTPTSEYPNPNTVTGSFKISDESIYVEIESKIISYGEDAVITVGSDEDISTINVIINGTTYPVKLDEDGEGTLTVQNLPIGKHKVVAKSGTIINDNNYITVVEGIKINQESYEKTSVSIALNDTSAEGNLIVKINDNLYKNQTLVNGKATVNITDLEMGTYTLLAYFDGNYSIEEKIEIISIKPKITLNNSLIITKNNTMTVTFPNITHTGTLKVLLNDNVIKEISAPSGSMTIPLTNLTLGDQEIKITYNDTEIYTGYVEVSPVVNVAKSVIEGSGSINFEFPSDASGKLTVTYYDDETEKDITQTVTLKNGKGSFSLAKIEEGFYEFEISYTGDSKYGNWDKIYEIDILAYEIECDDLSTEYTSNAKYGIYLTLDGYAVANKYVTFKINGKQLKAKTDNKGYAYITINYAPGKYPVTISYENAKEDADVVVNHILKAKKKITVKKSAKKSKVKITLKKVNKKYLKKKKVTLKIKGKKFKAKTNKKGVAIFKLSKKSLKKLKAGKKYTYTAIYKKDKIKGKVIVKK